MSYTQGKALKAKAANLPLTRKRLEDYLGQISNWADE